MTNEPQSISAAPMRTIKLSETSSLSQKSILTYTISTTPDGEIFFKIISNDGGGFWSSEFVSLSAIQQVTQDIPFEKPLTSYVLHPLFKGRSINTPAFLMAVLKAEGLVAPVEGNERCYLRCDPNEFMFNTDALIQSGVDLVIDDKPKKFAPIKAEVAIKKSPKKKAIAPQ